MSDSTQNKEVAEQNQQEGGFCCMKFVNRDSKLPVVESTLETATNIYPKVKDINSLTNWTFSTAERTVNKAIEVGKPLIAPVVAKLDGPIKKVDQMLCTGLDYVETNVSAIKLPPGELNMSESTQNKEVAQQKQQEGGFCCKKSVNRVSKLPVVESTLDTATNIYPKVKDINSLTNWTLINI